MNTFGLRACTGTGGATVYLPHGENFSVTEEYEAVVLGSGPEQVNVASASKVLLLTSEDTVVVDEGGGYGR